VSEEGLWSGCHRHVRSVEGHRQKCVPERVHEMACRQVSRVGASFQDDVTHAGVERLNHDLRRVQVFAGQREKDGPPTRQYLRSGGDLAGVHFHKVLGLSSVARHAPEASGALPIENGVPSRPTYAQWIACGTEHHGRAAANRDLFELTALPKADPLAVRREEGTPPCSAASVLRAMNGYGF